MIPNYGIKSSAFVKLTEELDDLLDTVPNAARKLYSWARRQAKPGKQIEICLSHFAEKYGFTLKWIKKGFDALVELGLFSIVQKYDSQWRKIIVTENLTPAVETSANENKSSKGENFTSNPENKSSSKMPLNPLSSVHITEISENYRPELVSSESVSQEKESDRTLPQTQPTQTESLVNGVTIGDDHFAAAAKIEDAISKPIPPSLRKLALEASLKVVEDAIAALNEAKQSKDGVRDEAAYLTSAIRKEWKPHKSGAIAGADLKAFGVWFDWARSKGIASCSRGVRDRISVMMGNEWVDFEEAVEQFPIV